MIQAYIEKSFDFSEDYGRRETRAKLLVVLRAIFNKNQVYGFKLTQQVVIPEEDKADTFTALSESLKRIDPSLRLVRPETANQQDFDSIIKWYESIKDLITPE